jgi:hypothetical protein
MSLAFISLKPTSMNNAADTKITPLHMPLLARACHFHQLIFISSIIRRSATSSRRIYYAYIISKLG